MDHLDELALKCENPQGFKENLINGFNFTNRYS